MVDVFTSLTRLRIWSAGLLRRAVLIVFNKWISRACRLVFPLPTRVEVNITHEMNKKCINSSSVQDTSHWYHNIRLEIECKLSQKQKLWTFKSLTLFNLSLHQRVMGWLCVSSWALLADGSQTTPTMPPTHLYGAHRWACHHVMLKKKNFLSFFLSCFNICTKTLMNFINL